MPKLPDGWSIVDGYASTRSPALSRVRVPIPSKRKEGMTSAKLRVKVAEQIEDQMVAVNLGLKACLETCERYIDHGPDTEMDDDEATVMDELHKLARRAKRFDRAVRRLYKNG